MPHNTFEQEPQVIHTPEKGETTSRISAAEQLYRAIEAGKDIDSDIAHLLQEAGEHGAVEDRIVADEVGGLSIVEGNLHGDQIPRLLGEQPADELGVALHDIELDKGEAALESIIERIEDVEQNGINGIELAGDVEILETPKTNNALWNKISKLTAEGRPYGGHKAYVRRIPLSLPTGAQTDYDASAIRYATGSEMKDVLEVYGVDAAVAEQAVQKNGVVEATALPPELQHALLTANIYEAMTRSNDPEIKRQASERNSHITVEDIWQPHTLHHVTRADKLAAILQNGHLGVMLNEGGDALVNNGGAEAWNLNFGKFFHEVAADAGHRQKVEALSYNDRGDVYIHYARPEGCYREGEEYDAGGVITLMSGGMPSTEISALTLRGGDQVALSAKTRDAVVEGGFYIPIFDIEGKLVYSKDDFDADIASVESGTYLSNEERGRIEHARVQKEAADREQQRLEQAAAAKGMTVEQYREWKAAQPIVRPMI